MYSIPCLELPQALYDILVYLQIGTLHVIYFLDKSYMNHLIQKQTKSKFNKLWHAGGNKYFCNIF